MKNYFINLFNYDRFAGELILKIITEAGNPDKPVQLFAHTLAAQQIWLSRCLGLPFNGVLWPELGQKFDNLGETLADNHQRWVSYLEGLNDGDFKTTIGYHNLQGQPFETNVTDIITQVINHGTHHRAQIGQLLKFAGTENLPNTDYISFTRYSKN